MPCPLSSVNNQNNGSVTLYSSTGEPVTDIIMPQSLELPQVILHMGQFFILTDGKYYSCTGYIHDSF